METARFLTRSDPNRHRRGQAGLFVVLNLTAILGVLGLSADVGFSYFVKQQAQTAADAAAMAAASYAASGGGTITCGSGGVSCGSASTCAYPNVTTPVNDYQVGCLYAAANGFVNNGSQTVTMQGNTTAPTGITGNAPSYWVQAVVSTQRSNWFGPLAGMNAFNIKASAMAAVTTYPAGACIYVLDPSAAQAFSATGASDTTATCGIFVNSNSPSAYYEYGSPKVTASQILVNGGTSITMASSVSPTPTTNAGPQPDPLASLALPTFSNASCDYNNISIGSTTTATLPYGTYCGGITINRNATVTFSGGTYLINDGLTVAGNSTVTFGAGLYILNGSNSGVALSFGNSTVVSGSGVTFFITGQYSGHTIGNVQSTGATTVNLAAPTSGAYKGMLFLQDRNLTYSNVNSFANSAASVLQGTLYFPTTSVTYSGASSTGTYTALIGKKISFVGSASFKNDPTGSFTGLATTVRGLIQ